MSVIYSTTCIHSHRWLVPPFTSLVDSYCFELSTLLYNRRRDRTHMPDLAGYHCLAFITSQIHLNFSLLSYVQSLFAAFKPRNKQRRQRDADMRPVLNGRQQHVVIGRYRDEFLAKIHSYVRTFKI